ncbi:hypothetical protein [Burkholderia cepacia]|nr:hypothetical protein [Burkholderia cepacia]
MSHRFDCQLVPQDIRFHITGLNCFLGQTGNLAVAGSAIVTCGVSIPN